MTCLINSKQTKNSNTTTKIFQLNIDNYRYLNATTTTTTTTTPKKQRKNERVGITKFVISSIFSEKSLLSLSLSMCLLLLLIKEQQLKNLKFFSLSYSHFFLLISLLNARWRRKWKKERNPCRNNKFFVFFLFLFPPNAICRRTERKRESNSSSLSTRARFYAK